MKAPKSGFGVFPRRLLRRVSARTTMPATPIPRTNQSLGLEAWSLISFNDLDIVDQRIRERERMGFGRVLELQRKNQFSKINKNYIYFLILLIDLKTKICGTTSYDAMTLGEGCHMFFQKYT